MDSEASPRRESRNKEASPLEGIPQQEDKRDSAAQRREEMVRLQLERRGIADRSVLGAMRRVPRERFLPAELAGVAYADTPLPIAAQQTISQPYVVALMAQALELEAHERVLEIGTGSGYAAAVLAELAAEVHTVERHCELADAARVTLAALGYTNVFVRCGDGTLGWPDAAPFDAIVAAASGPEVPTALREQLAVGGRLVMPVGKIETAQELVRVRRVGEQSFTQERLGSVRFVPLIGAQGFGMRRADDLAARVAGAAEPFDAWQSAELDKLLGRIGAARVVLLGEASHGTDEFYALRARITQALVERGGVRIVAVEADWPDARQIDSFVRGAAARAHPERAFTRFPTWMWANTRVLDFAHWLKGFNASCNVDDQCGFYGLDLYSLYTSLRAVLAYLDDVDPEAAAAARRRYECLAPWEADPAAYGAATVRGRFEGCADEAVAILDDLLARRLEYAAQDRERFFDAARNAELVKNAEHYYRAIYHGTYSSWNLRDTHMFETLIALLEHAGRGARAVVWAHNSHLGNAAATAMGARGETNLGELCRRHFGSDCYAIGFGTDHGTVAAASDWGGPHEIKAVRPAHEMSYEHVCHQTRLGNFFLPFAAGTSSAARAALMRERLERAIGVIYRPATELQSHYFRASLPRQFDEWIWLDETHAVEALPVPTDARDGAATFPFGY